MTAPRLVGAAALAAALLFACVRTPTSNQDAPIEQSYCGGAFPEIMERTRWRP